MTPVEAVDVQLCAARARWQAAVRDENRAAESAVMARINQLLDQRTTLAAAASK